MRWWWNLIVLSAFIVAAEDDYYRVLGVSKRATIDEVRKAYKTLTRKYHPDINKSPDATSRFSAVAEAYEVLSDPKKRQRYDRYGKEGLSREEKPRADSIFDLFGFGAHNKPQRDKAEDSTLKLYVSLSQLYHGDHITVKYTRPVLCLRAEDCVVQRSDCVGPGTSMTARQVAPGYYVEHQSSDPLCISRGRGLKSNKCKHCPQGLTYLETTTVFGYIDPGMKDNDIIKFEGAGYQQLDLEPGDLRLVVEQEREDNLFLRDADNNLHTQLYITLLESLLGFETYIPHVSGKKVKVAKLGTTSDGEHVIIPGHGMPFHQQTGKFGDLKVRIRVRYPLKPNGFTQQEKDWLTSVLGSQRDWVHLSVPNTLNT